MRRSGELRIIPQHGPAPDIDTATALGPGPVRRRAGHAVSPAPAAVPRWHGYALLVLLAALWGSSYAALKVAVETIPPLTTMALRALLGGLVLFALLGRRAGQLARRDAPWRAFFVQSLLLATVPWICLGWAARIVDSSLVAILNSTSPIFVFLLTCAYTRHEPASARKLLGVILGIGGVVTIVGLEALGGVGRHTAAQVGCVFAAFCYAVAAIYGRTFEDVPPMVTAAASLVCATALLVPASLVFDHPWTVTPSARSLAAVAALAVLSTALAQTVYYRLLALLGSIATASQSYLRILMSVFLGVVLLGEPVTPSLVVGVVLVVGGVVAMASPVRRAPAAAPTSR